jgi:hypothetical protein
VRALPLPVRRVSPHLLGPPLPALAALWQAGGRRRVTAAICVVLPLTAGVVLGRPDLGAAGSLCAFTAIYGHALPYRRRAVVVAAVGATLTVASVLGALSGGHPVALSLVVGGLALAATAATTVWRVGPPGPIGVALVCGGSSALGSAHGQLAFHLLAAGGGALLSWCACMLPWFWIRPGPNAGHWSPPSGRSPPERPAVPGRPARARSRRPCGWPTPR